MVSLGQASNYSMRQVWRHLFAYGTANSSLQLAEKLAQRYGVEPSQVALYHTGRSALTAALMAVAPQGNVDVIVPGLTCIAVIRAIKAAHCRPVFVDIEPTNLEYNYTKLEQKLAALQSQASPIDNNDDVCYNGSIILVQNTLGISWHAEKLLELAEKYHATLVEDLAHCAGRLYADGREVGTIGAAAALSFGKGKAIDTISGGATIIRQGALPPAPLKLPKLSDRWRDRWYPLFGAIARGTWKSGFGRVFMGGLVKIGWVQRSADAELDLNHRLTHWQARLACAQLDQLVSSPLRDFRLVHDRAQVLRQLECAGYYFDEIWYDTPVSPRRYLAEADFPAAECPQTVQIAEQIINIPTWYYADRLQSAYQIIKEYEIS